MNAIEAQTQKRIFDLFWSVFLVFLIFLPCFILTFILLIYFKDNPIFVQYRVGQNARIFKLYKFRTIGGKDPISITETTISSFSRWMLTYKLNELPQLINIINGDMSFVGPRPDVLGYADKLTGEDRIILKVKPGLTGPATLKYRNEAELLQKESDPKRFNDEMIWPDKIKINKNYIANWSLKTDIKILFKTIFPASSIFDPGLY